MLFATQSIRLFAVHPFVRKRMTRKQLQELSVGGLEAMVSPSKLPVLLVFIQQVILVLML